MRESDFKQFMQLRNRLDITTEKFSGKQNLSLVHIPTISKDMDDQLRLAQRVVDVVIVPREKYLWLCALKSGQAREFIFSSQMNCKKKEEEKFQQTVCVKQKLDEFLCLRDVMNLYIIKCLLWVHLQFYRKVIATIYPHLISIYSSWDEFEQWRC